MIERLIIPLLLLICLWAADACERRSTKAEREARRRRLEAHYRLRR